MVPPTWCSVLSPQICPLKTLQHPYPGVPNYLGLKICDHLSHRIPLNICWFTQINQCIPLLIFIPSNISTMLFMFLSLEFPKLNSCMHKKNTKNQNLLEDTSWRHSSHQATSSTMLPSISFSCAYHSQKTWRVSKQTPSPSMFTTFAKLVFTTKLMNQFTYNKHTPYP